LRCLAVAAIARGVQEGASRAASGDDRTSIPVTSKTALDEAQ
jgi:hypothetical protein